MWYGMGQRIKQEVKKTYSTINIKFDYGKKKKKGKREQKQRLANLIMYFIQWQFQWERKEKTDSKQQTNDHKNYWQLLSRRKKLVSI